MHRIKAVGVALLALLAVSAIVVDGASAKAKTLSLTYNEGTEQQVKAGEAITFANTVSEVVEVGGGAITCPSGPSEYNALLATDETNNAAKDALTASPEPDLAPCASTASVFGPLPEFEYLKFGPAGPPYGDLVIGTKLTAEYKERAKGEVIAFGVTANGLECVYSFTKIKGAVTTGKNALSEPIMEISFTKAKLKFDKEHSEGACPRTATYTAAFQAKLTATGAPVTYHLN